MMCASRCQRLGNSSFFIRYQTILPTYRGFSYKICFEPQKCQEDTKGLSQKE